MIRNYLMGGAIALATPAVIAQPAFAQGIAVTNIQFQQTDSGLELILESPTGKQPETFQTTYGETLIIDLINTQLQLPEGEQISQDNPAPGIASVEVVQQYANTVRVKLVGTEEVPTAKVNTTGQGFAFNVSTEMTTAQEPAPAPTPEEEAAPTPQQPEAGQQEPIELVVTATRTEERQEDVPRSVTVIDREEIEQQSQLDRNLGNILGRTVPGLGPPNFTNRSNAQTLRGREFSVLIDGVPTKLNRSTNVQLSYIDPSAIERIEVVRGPTAIFGGDAVGGVINIITRSPTEEGFKATTEIGTDAALGNLEGESFGNEQRQTLFYKKDNLDLTLTLSRERTGTSFDAEGDRRPTNNTTTDNTESFNVLGKVGVDLTEDQRLQLTANHKKNDIDFELLSVPNPDPEGKGLVEEKELDFTNGATPPGIDNTLISLDYTHEDLWGSELKVQGFYRTSQTANVPLDDRGGFFDNIANGVRDEKLWGGRLQVETPLSPGTDVLWGTDLEFEENEPVISEVADPEAFDEQDEFQKTKEISFGPEFDVNKLGLFAQVQSQLNDRLRLSGGLRYNRFELKVDDFVPAFDPEFDIIGRPGFDRRVIEGGEPSFDDVTFNLGAVYQVSPSLNVFGKFSQGFSLPNFGNLLDVPPSGFAVNESFQDLQPVKVDEFELGIRGNWSSVQFSLAGFFNQSDLGARLAEVTSNEEVPILTLQRAPERIYGIEATVDAQVSDDWQLGGLVSWNKGENDPNDDGDFQPLSSFEIQPIKLSAYVQNQTTSDWNNRLQLLVVGGRDRAFEEGVDDTEIESYAVLDYISSVELGPGTLEIGIQNLLDNQYFPVFQQLEGRNLAAPGRTVRLNYSVTW
jgi:iron complex outermembrane receptor protein